MVTREKYRRRPSAPGARRTPPLTPIILKFIETIRCARDATGSRLRNPFAGAVQAGRKLLPAPVDRREFQSPPVHFLAQPFGILPDRLTDETIASAAIRVGLDLTPNAFVKHQQTVIFGI